MSYTLEGAPYQSYIPTLPGAMTARLSDNGREGLLQGLSPLSVTPASSGEGEGRLNEPPTLYPNPLESPTPTASALRRFGNTLFRVIKAPLTPLARFGTLPFPFFDPARYRQVYWDRLNEFSGGTERANACHVLATYIKDYHLHLFRYPPHLNSDKWHWTATIFRGRSGEYTWYGDKFRRWAEGNESLFFHAIESTLLKGIGGLSQRIASIATDSENMNYDHDFVFDVVAELLRLTVEHLSRINEAFRQWGPDIDTDMLRAEFGVNLHRGLPSDVRLNDAERRQWSLFAFFNVLSQKLLEIALPGGASDIEFPFGLRNWTYHQLQGSVLPNALLDVTEMILDPYNLDSLLLMMIEYYNGQNAPPSPGQSSPLPAKVDNKQKRLNKLCEDFVKELLTLFEPKLAKSLLKIPQLKEKLGACLGSAIREKASSKWTVDGIINSIVEVWLPTFHAGAWEKIDGKKVFLPYQQMKSPTGEVMSWPTREFAFTHFAKNELQRREMLETLAAEQEEFEKRLLKELDKTLNQEIKRAVPDFLNALWIKVRPKIEPWVEGYFGKGGLHVAKLVIGLTKLILSCVIVALAVLLYPLTRFVGILVDEYTKRKAKDIVKCLQMDIHRNLLYACIETLVSSLDFNNHNRVRVIQNG